MDSERQRRTNHQASRRRRNEERTKQKGKSRNRIEPAMSEQGKRARSADDGRWSEQAHNAAAREDKSSGRTRANVRCKGNGQMHVCLTGPRCRCRGMKR